MRQLLRLLKDALAALGRWIGEIPYGRIASRIIKFIGDLLHRVLFTVLLPKRYRSLTKQQIYTIIFKSDTGGLETYNSLSPRASNKLTKYE